MLLCSTIALVYTCPCAIAFQTSSVARIMIPSQLQASRVGFGGRNSQQPEPRTWNLQRRKTRNNNNSKTSDSLQPILPNGASIDTDAGQQGRQRKKMKPMPVIGYDAQSILDFYDRRPLRVGWRLNSLGLPLLWWYLGLLTDTALGIADKPSVQRKRGEELRHHLVRSQSVALIKVSTLCRAFHRGGADPVVVGSVYGCRCKSGQALSLRPDIMRNKAWAEELGKLVDAVGAFPDTEAMKIMKREFADLQPRMKVTKSYWKEQFKRRKLNARTNLEKLVANDPILSLFEFSNDNKAVASASIGQVYKAKIRRGAQLEAAIGKEMANKWGGKVVAIKVQRPDVAASASLDMYLLRRTAMWLSRMRGGGLPAIADQ